MYNPGSLSHILKSPCMIFPPQKTSKGHNAPLWSCLITCVHMHTDIPAGTISLLSVPGEFFEVTGVQNRS